MFSLLDTGLTTIDGGVKELIGIFLCWSLGTAVVVIGLEGSFCNGLSLQEIPRWI